MRTEIIGDYEIEYSGVQLLDSDGWAAHVAVYGPSTNPMHRNIIFPDQRVSLETVFPDEQTAEDEAHRVGRSMIQ
jgi:hypothetical protein